ncbi:MAG: hypothetical protein II739_02290 [Clostridia bacterium]|nr:hypothetical protein [Clostridia bacterium]
MKREELYDVIAGLDEDIQERAYELEHTERKTVPFMKVFVPVAASLAAILLVAAVLLAVFASKMNKGPHGGNDDPDGKTQVTENPALAFPTEPPAGETQIPAETATPSQSPAPTEIATAEPTQTPENSSEPTTFTQDGVTVTYLSYKNANRELISFNGGSVGAEMIPTDVMGEHSGCGGVYYNQYTGEIICLEHEFIKASGINVGKERLEFIVDRADRNNVAVTVLYENHHTPSGIWVMNRSEGTVTALPLPDGYQGFRAGVLSLYVSDIYDGVVCVCVNSSQAGHYISLYDYKAGKTETAHYVEGKRTTGVFLTGNILEIQNFWDTPSYDGETEVVNHHETLFYNLDTKILVGLQGDSNYYFGGKVFSVDDYQFPSSGVAAYDAATGEVLANEKVLVIRENKHGSIRQISIKDTTTGEETVITENALASCMAWSDDNSRFYAYSLENGELYCYFTESQTWATISLKGISKDPEQIDGRVYAVFVDYSLAVGDNPEDVTIYYSRTLQEVPETPAYEDERVDSPCWDEYRDIKFWNGFEKETYFQYATRENIIHGDGFGSIHTKRCDDFNLLKSLIIYSLESRGGFTETKEFKVPDSVLVCAVYCRSFHMSFYELGDGMFLRIDREYSPLVEVVSGIYEFPKEAFQKIEEALAAIVPVPET